MPTNTLMSTLTTVGIGGPAKEVIFAKTEHELIGAIQNARKNKLPYLVIGSGSNLLVADEGVDMLIIKNEDSDLALQVFDSEIAQTRGGESLQVQSGTLLQDLVDFSIKQGLSGFHKLTGIPGTVGGAIYGNAGAYGQTISDNLQEVRAFNGQEIITLSKDECGFDYRESNFKKNGLIILSASFKLSPGNSSELAKESQALLAQRKEKYPKGIKCPGSFFKNIPTKNIPPKILKEITYQDTYGKIPAWYFLDEVGAKGAKKGKITIASFHGNLFINTGGGKARDFHSLASKYAQKVKEKFGITLEPEVQLIGLPPLINL